MAGCVSENPPPEHEIPPGPGPSDGNITIVPEGRLWIDIVEANTFLGETPEIPERLAPHQYGIWSTDLSNGAALLPVNTLQQEPTRGCVDADCSVWLVGTFLQNGKPVASGDNSWFAARLLFPTTDGRIDYAEWRDSPSQHLFAINEPNWAGPLDIGTGWRDHYAADTDEDALLLLAYQFPEGADALSIAIIHSDQTNNVYASYESGLEIIRSETNQSVGFETLAEIPGAMLSYSMPPPRAGAANMRLPGGEFGATLTDSTDGPATLDFQFTLNGSGDSSMFGWSEISLFGISDPMGTFTLDVFHEGELKSYGGDTWPSSAAQDHPSMQGAGTRQSLGEFSLNLEGSWASGQTDPIDGYRTEFFLLTTNVDVEAITGWEVFELYDDPFEPQNVPL